MTPLMRVCRRKSSRMNAVNHRKGVVGGITAGYLVDLFNKQDGKCALTGRSLVISPDSTNPNALSLDRIKLNLWYVPGNVRFITNQANSARGQGSDAQLIKFCKDVLRGSR